MSSTDGLKEVRGHCVYRGQKGRKKNAVAFHKWQITVNLKKALWELSKAKSFSENCVTGQLLAHPFPSSSSLTTGCPKEGEKTNFGDPQQPAPFEASGRGEPRCPAPIPINSLPFLLGVAAPGCSLSPVPHRSSLAEFFWYSCKSYLLRTTLTGHLPSFKLVRFTTLL